MHPWCCWEVALAVELLPQSLEMFWRSCLSGTVATLMCKTSFIYGKIIKVLNRHKYRRQMYYILNARDMLMFDFVVNLFSASHVSSNHACKLSLSCHTYEFSFCFMQCTLCRRRNCPFHPVAITQHRKDVSASQHPQSTCDLLHRCVFYSNV